MAVITGGRIIEGSGLGQPLTNAGAPSAGTDEAQRLTIGGTPTAGTFTLTFDGYTTAAITWSATNATLLTNIETALEALPNIDGVTLAEVSLTAGIGTLDITFSGAEVGKRVQPIMTYTSLLTGTAPTLAIAEQVAGVGATGLSAPKGATLIDTTNGREYINMGTDSAPVWVGVTGYYVEAAEVTFTETTGAGTYTGSVTVPAGATILDIQVRSTAVWTATTTALMDVGDAADPDGWYTQINLKATDLVVGEVIRFESTGGKEGAYLVVATGELEKSYNAAAVVVSGIIVTVGAAGNAGRTRMLVSYVLPIATAATKA